jgi:phenylacetate-CoA ligase
MPAPSEMQPWRTVSAGLDAFAFLGSACGEHRGAHVCEDEAIVEAVDPATGEPVPEGTRGHLVVTSLTKDNFMLRYDLQDLVRLDRGECACGETHVRAFWDGRGADAVVVAGRTVLPLDVQIALADIEAVALPALEYQLVRTADQSVLRVRVEAHRRPAGLEQDMKTSLEEALGVPVTLELLDAGALPRPAYKPLRVVDE